MDDQETIPSSGIMPALVIRNGDFLVVHQLDSDTNNLIQCVAKYQGEITIPCHKCIMLKSPWPDDSCIGLRNLYGHFDITDIFVHTYYPLVIIILANKY